MDTTWLWFAAPGAVIWLTVLLAPWRPWSTRERLEGDTALGAPRAHDITVIIPARNEALHIGHTLNALQKEIPESPVILVDDQSADGTTDAAHAVSHPALRVITGQPMPAGWTGKLWALEQGLEAVRTPLVLLLDADIEVSSGIVARMVAEKRQRGVELLSLMATLRANGFWERLLLPSFVFFFKLLYPFRIANSASPWVAAAAGGCVLVDTATLRSIGGFAAYRGELIDDCALAARVKEKGGRTWIGLSRSVTSHRRYEGLGDLWQMVARTAYTQLKYSPLLLAVCVVLMVAAFCLPLIGLLAPDPLPRWIAVTAVVAMVLSYLPTLHFYRLSPLWSLLLPLTGILYLGMTIDSARRYYQGRRSSWRGREYGLD